MTFELTAPPLGGWPIGPAGAAAAAPPSIHLGLNSATFALKVKSFAVALSLLAGLTGAASLSSAGFAVVSLESPAGVGAAAVSASAVLSATVASEVSTEGSADAFSISVVFWSVELLIFTICTIKKLFRTLFFIILAVLLLLFSYSNSLT